MRGAQAFKEVFPSNLNTTNEKHKSYIFKQRRDEKVAARFYYYGGLHRFSYETTLECLEKEFDISFSTLQIILKDQLDLVQKYEKEKTSPKELAKKYPYFNWSVMRHSMLD